MFFMEISLRSQGQFQCWDKEQQRPGRGLCRVEGWGGVSAQPCCGIFLCWFCPSLINEPALARAFWGLIWLSNPLALAGEHQHLPSAPILAPVGSFRWRWRRWRGNKFPCQLSQLNLGPLRGEDALWGETSCLGTRVLSTLAPSSQIPTHYSLTAQTPCNCRASF